jgi:hypothetical protein
MDDAAVLAVLAGADASPALPRLGGVARADGVAIVSERAWCFSRAAGGATASGAMPSPPALVTHIPLVGGLARLSLSFAPLFARNGAASLRDRLLLAGALAAPLPLAFVPGPARTLALAGLTALLLVWLLRGRALFLHGAEHRAIAAAEARSLVATWHGERAPSRFSRRCGTNFAALLVPVSLLLDRFWVLPSSALTPVFVSLAALALTMEIWRVAQRSPSSASVLMLPGLALQRLTTREPRLEETRVALRAVAGVLVLERAA